MAFQRSGIVLAEVARSSVLNLANAFSIGLKSGEYGGREKSLAPACLIASRAPPTRGGGRFSLVTITPGLCLGTRMAATYVRNASPSIGPSMTMGAAIPVARKPAVKVVVFQ